jgi:RNA polymerase sigma-70 factor (ECF subfamily)
MTTPTPSYQLFDQLFEATKDKLYAFVLKHTRDKHQTEDILQHCYMKLWEHIDGVDVTRIDNLLFTYARHAVIDQVRKMQASIITFKEVMDDQVAHEPATENGLNDAERSRQVLALVNKMPPKRKQVFVLVREYGMSYDEVAERLGISKLTIKKHMNEALRFLREEAAVVQGQHYVLLAVALFSLSR